MPAETPSGSEPETKELLFLGRPPQEALEGDQEALRLWAQQVVAAVRAAKQAEG